MLIHKDLAERAIEKVGAIINLRVREVAEGIIRLVNNNMAKAISIVSVERGRDPREFSLIAFGGAGPLHCCDLADELEIRRIIVPIHAGLLSAYGLLTADLSRMFALPVLTKGGSLEPHFARLVRMADRTLKQEEFESHSLRKYVDMRYNGQSYELTLSYNTSADMKQIFSERHKAVYGYSSSDEVEIVNVKISATVPTATVRGKTSRCKETSAPTPRMRRDVWFGSSYEMTPVHRREDMKPGVSGRGPTVIEEYDSTLVINPGWRWSIQEHGTEISR